jgi:exopolysaccharide biosynthesis polyprenyl glycosylphosphotransferase
VKNNASLAYALLLVIGDFFALLAAFSIAYILRVKFDPRPLIHAIPAWTYFSSFIVVLPLWLLVHALIGLYDQKIYEKRFTEFGRLLIGSILGILVIIGYDFVTNNKLFPARLVPVYSLALGFGFLVLFRAMARIARRSLYSFGIGVSNVLLVGDTAITEQVGDAIRNSRTTGQRVLGVVARRSQHFKTYASFSAAVKHIGPELHSIIQTELYADQAKNDEILTYAQENHVAYRFVPGNSELFVGNLEVELFGGSMPMIAVHQTALIGWGRIAKRLFDIVFGILLLVLFSPLFLLTALAVKLTDPRGPVFMRGVMQQRLTRFNRVFNVLKFRSHYAKYDGKTDEEVFRMIGKPELIKEYRRNGDKLDHDFRVTPVGRFLRRTSLDEMPQIINVIRGDISLVGPRALVPHELAEYSKRHTILSVKSGITGLAQVSGRRDISFEERRKLDTYYVQNWSFWLDLTILLKTVKTVITGAFQG